jgi:hypothetical protein
LMVAFSYVPAKYAAAQDNPFGEVGPDGGRAADPAAGAPASSDEEKTILDGQHANPATDSREDFCQCVGEGDSIAVARIEKALRSPLASSGLDFVEVPLEEVVNLLQEDYGIPIQLDLPSMEAMGLSAEEKVTANIHNVSLQSALSLLLKKLQLTYVIRDEVLQITSPEEAESYLRTCVYNVREFVEDTSDESVANLIDTIVSCVATETWAENGGGESEIRPLRPGLLVVSQTQAVHDEISSLLKAIRDMRGEHGHADHAAAGADAKEVATRSYVLQLDQGANAEKISESVRTMILQALPDEQWEGRLPDGQSVMLVVLPGRIVVRQTPLVHERVAALIKDSGLGKAAASEPNRRRTHSNDAAMNRGDMGGGGGGGFFSPPMHDARIEE